MKARSSLYVGCMVVVLAALATPALAGPVYVPAVRELTEQRTETSRTWLLADGTYRAEFSVTPIHYQAEDRSWQPIDTTLSPTSRPGFALANETNGIKTYLPAGASGWVRVETTGGSVAFHPIGALNGNPTAHGSKLDLDDIGNGVSLSYEVQPGRLKEAITLNAPRASSFSFSVRLEGLTAQLNQDNSVTLADTNGQPALCLESPWMQDADGHRSTAIGVSLAQTADGPIYTLTPDPAFLSSARYPVVIDPTTTYNIKRTYPDRTAVVRKSYPTTEYFPGLSYYGGSAGEYPAVGATSADDAYRTVVYIGDTLPLDSDVTSATLHMPIDHVQYGGDITLQAYDPYSGTSIPQPGSGGVTWNSVGDPPANATTSPTYFYYSDGPPTSIDFDVTNIVQSWDERRDDAVAASQAIVIRDTSDTGSSSSGTLYFFKSQNYAGNIYLSVTYTQGWYMFQGNMRHTGRTQVAVSPDATLQWVEDLGLPYSSGMEPAMGPAVLAVPNPVSPVGAPVVYAVVSDGSTSSTVKRVVDATPRSIASKTLPITPGLNGEPSTFVVSGTPLCYAGKLFVVGNTLPNQDAYRNEPVDIGYPVNHGYMYVLNATTLGLAWTNTVDHPNPIYFRGPVYSSPTPNPTLVLDHNGVYQNGVLLTANYPDPGPTSEYHGCLYCKSVADGSDLWTGSPLRIEYNEMIFAPATYSSPAVSGGSVFVGDANGWVAARSAADGSVLWDKQPSIYNPDDENEDSGMEASPSISKGQLYVCALEDEHDPGYSDRPHRVARMNMSDGSTEWEFDSTFGNPWTTPALDTDYTGPNGAGNVAIVDDFGDLYGMGMPADPTRYPTETWTAYLSSGTVPSPARCSPLVAGAPGASDAHRYIFVAGYDGHIYVFTTASGALWAGDPYLYGSFPPTIGPIQSSMAAFQGRVYALDLNGNLYCYYL